MDECPKIFIKKNEYYLETSQNQKKDIIHKRLDEVNFSFRALNGLKNQNLIYLGDLVNYTEKQILAIPKLGRNSLNEIKQVLEELGLKLNMNLQNWPPKIIEKEIYNSKIEKREKFIELSLEQKYFISKILEETNLSVRAINCLRNLNCKYVGDIIHLGKEDIKRSHNMGKKSFNEIVSLIETAGMEIGENIEPWSYEIAESIRTYIEKNDKDDSAEKFVLQDKYLEVELHRVIKQSIIQRSGRLKGTAEESIERGIQVIIDRYGLDGAPYKTLEVIGQKYNVTRERIRQIERKTIRKILSAKLSTPILKDTFNFIEKLLPASTEQINQLLKKKDLTKQEWDFKGLRELATFFGYNKKSYYVKKINKKVFLIKENLYLDISKILKVMKNRISDSGLYSIKHLQEMKEVYLNNLNAEFLRDLAFTNASFYWLDDEKNWFTFYSSRNRLSNLISKAVIANKFLGLNKLYKSIKKNYRINKNLLFSKEVLLKYCEINYDCVSDKNKILEFKTDQPKLSDYKGYKGDRVAPNEKKIINIFRNYGPILSWDDLKELASINGITQASLTMMTQFSPFFERIDRATYILQGTKLTDKNKNIVKIDFASRSFLKKNCPYVSKKNAYVEIYNYGKYLRTIAYQRPIRKIDEENYGICVDNKIYPIKK